MKPVKRRPKKASREKDARSDGTAPDPSDGLYGPVSAVKGVGPKTARALEQRGVRTIEDLFYLMPVRFEDRRAVGPIAECVEGEENTVAGRVIDGGQAYSRASRKRICYARIDDGTGVLTLRWFRFNRSFLSSVCKKGTVLLASGKVIRYGAELQIVHPKVTVMEEGQSVDGAAAIFPVYPEIEDVSQGTIRNIIGEAFTSYQDFIETAIPGRIIEYHQALSLKDAFARCHLPDGAPPGGMDNEAALARIVLEEFFLFQASLLLKKRAENRGKGPVEERDGGVDGTEGMKPGRCHALLVEQLPFSLTSGQRRVLSEIEQDMASGRPMNRLLQGDVGSGKTICAVLAAATALDGRRQAVFMAPTEILAEQHYLGIHRMLKSAGIETCLVRGNMGAERAEVLGRIATGNARVVVGTHALLQPDVVFHRLGLVVIDEQHRFGVIQRSLLRDKGGTGAPAPHVLVMSATPIPRTLSMVVYGDLDVSVIHDMPSCRQRVRTEVVDKTERRKVYDAVLRETGRGRQVFIVHPLVEESEQAGIIGAKEGLREWQEIFPHLRLGLLHGRMKAEEKEAVMLALRAGEIDVMVCTTVVEVGIDVPNATLMVVEHAERFGLSQLHQLRGRVGRGEHPATCLLVSPSGRTAAATKRLKALEQMEDGFAIAEEDMRLRGPGDMIGVRQSGLPAFRIGNLVRDGEIMSRARRMAQETVESADGEDLARLEGAARRRWGEERIPLGEVL